MEEANRKIQEIDAGRELWETSTYEGCEESTEKKEKCGGILFLSHCQHVSNKTDSWPKTEKNILRHHLENIWK